MDIKTNERILKSIFELKNKDSDILNKPVSNLLKKLPDLSKEIIESSIDDLATLGHLEVHAGDEIFYILVRSSAVGYLKEIEARRIDEDNKKWETRKWNIIQVIIGGIIGSILTIICQYILKKM